MTSMVRSAADILAELDAAGDERAMPIPRRTSPHRKGCPSQSQYRRHLAAGEKCQRCRDLMAAKERQRRERRGAR